MMSESAAEERANYIYTSQRISCSDNTLQFQDRPVRAMPSALRSYDRFASRSTEWGVQRPPLKVVHSRKRHRCQTAQNEFAVSCGDKVDAPENRFHFIGTALENQYKVGHYFRLGRCSPEQDISTTKSGAQPRGKAAS